MPNEDHHDEKPLSDVLRARHSEHGKRRGLHGKTARKLHNQRYSPATECGLTSSNKYDAVQSICTSVPAPAAVAL